jgi:hypothetical protein
MNFEADLIENIISILKAHGIRCSKTSFHDSLLDYLTYCKKFIPIQQRVAYFSTNVQNDSIGNRNEAYQAIVHRAKTGGDLNCYQSESLKEVKFHDYLLYTWHIHHFHLSTRANIKNPYFKKRTNGLLFAYVNLNSIYFLGFDVHREGVFADEKWLSIIQTNWPELLEEYKREHITELSFATTPKERQTLWSRGYTTGSTNVNGIVYNDTGVGIMASGHSLETVLQVDRVQRWIYQVTCQYIANKDSIHREISKKFLVPVEKIAITARIKDTIEIYDRLTGQVIFAYH